MNWASLDTLPVGTITPIGYRYEQISRHDIDAVAEKLRRWYPDISVGAAHGFVKKSFYENHVFLAAEIEKDLIVYVCRKEGEIVSMTAIERDLQSSTIQGRLTVVSPDHRNSGLARFGPFILDHQAKAMGIALAYNHVSLKHAYAQKLVERAGFTLVGIMPASDREMVEPGVIKHVPEAIYAKVYASDSTLFSPTAECMTQAVSELWRRLFEN